MSSLGNTSTAAAGAVGPRAAQAGERYYRRFTRNERILHSVLMLSFVGCALTGLPLLFADTRTGAVAAVHAGWRGAAAGTATAALDALSHEFGSRPDDVIVAIGPRIGACCYEVGSELVDAFAAAGHARHLVDRWFSVGDRESGIPDRAPGARERSRLRLDVAAANRDRIAPGRGLPRHVSPIIIV